MSRTATLEAAMSSEASLLLTTFRPQNMKLTGVNDANICKCIRE